MRHPSRRLRACSAIALLAPWLVACGPSDEDPGLPEAPESSPPIFADVSEAVGLDFTHRNGRAGGWHLPEVMGAGAALFDFDNDGDLDAYLVQGAERYPPSDAGRGGKATGQTDRLYRNELLHGKPETLTFRDVTAESGLRAGGYGMGVATGDYDNDGWTDLYVTNDGPNQLWRNQGDGTFRDVTATAGEGVDDPRFSVSAAFLDYDRDGWLDLMWVNYVDYDPSVEVPCATDSGQRDYCSPLSFRPVADRLLRNLGDGRFEDVSAQAGIADAPGSGLGLIHADFDADARPDVFVANDMMENRLWLATEEESFRDAALLSGAALNRTGAPEAGMGVEGADFDEDGDVDLFLTHLLEETHTLYANDGAGLFRDETGARGLEASSLPFTGFGSAALDFDNDGWLDLAVANGEVRIIPEQLVADASTEGLPMKQGNQLFRNQGEGNFAEVTAQAGEAFARAEVSRGVAMGDVDNDGDSDLLIHNNDGPARLLRNEVGAARPWLGLRLVDPDSGRDLLGASARLERAEGHAMTRRAHSDGGYASARDPRLLFGLGEPDPEAEIVIDVTWPDGSHERWVDLAPGRYHTLERGAGHAIGGAP